MFIPPRSPYSLIQEELFNQPFWLLIACILLNRSSRVVAQRVLSELMIRWPAPSDIVSADQQALADCVKCLGFVKRRTAFVSSLARAAASHQDLLQQKGIGEYAKRSYTIFCCGELGESGPDDGSLKRY